MSFKGHIKGSVPNQLAQPPSQVLKQQVSTDYLDFRRNRNLIRSTTPSAPDRNPALMDALALSEVSNLLETGALQLQ